jgi:N-carbamoylputrescine amidase
MSRVVRGGLIQVRADVSLEGSTDAIKQRMLDKHLPLIEEAARRGVQLLCLQELFNGPYFCAEQQPRWYEMVERIPDGPTIQTMQALAKKHGMVMVVPIYEEEITGIYYNAAAVIDADGTYLGKYRKMHIPDDPQYYEKFYFTPGDLGFRAWDTRFGRIGVLICWDQWYPEAARLTALSGAQILFYPTAIGWLPAEKQEHGAQQQSAWETIQRSHAIANGVYVCAVNRVGHEGDPAGGIEFWGGSFVSDPGGRVLVRGGTGEEVLTASCDLSKVNASRTHWPFFRDRRIDAYGDITRRYLD